MVMENGMVKEKKEAKKLNNNDIIWWKFELTADF